MHMVIYNQSWTVITTTFELYEVLWPFEEKISKTQKRSCKNIRISKRPKELSNFLQSHIKPKVYIPVRSGLPRKKFTTMVN